MFGDLTFMQDDPDRQTIGSLIHSPRMTGQTWPTLAIPRNCAKRFVMAISGSSRHGARQIHDQLIVVIV